MLIYTTGRFITDMPCPGLYCGESHGPCLCPCPCPDCGGKKRMSVCGPYTSKHIQAQQAIVPWISSPSHCTKQGASTHGHLLSWPRSRLRLRSLRPADLWRSSGRCLQQNADWSLALVGVRRSEHHGCQLHHCLSVSWRYHADCPHSRFCGCNHARVRNIPVSLPVSCRVRVPAALPVAITVTVTITVGGPRGAREALRLALAQGLLQLLVLLMCFQPGSACMRSRLKLRSSQTHSVWFIKMPQPVERLSGSVTSAAGLQSAHL